MRLRDYLDGIRAALTSDQLETALQAPYTHSFTGPTWTKICKARIEAGRRICSDHQLGRFVPIHGLRRALSVCGETYKVGYGGNSTGERYVWHSAQQWAESVLRGNGFSRRAAHAIWDWSRSYPHRSLQAVERALAGELADPPFDVLIRHKQDGRAPITVNRDTEWQHRAHRTCDCGGVLWDWGCGWNGWAHFIQWRCDTCSAVFDEYLIDGRLQQIRGTKIPVSVPAASACPNEVFSACPA